jgi:hypothetical protein
MRARKWRGTIWAARLGLLALALNALVPVHLAFDLAEASEPTHLCGTDAEVDNGERQLLALLSGHRGADGRPEEHGKRHACPVCSAIGSLAVFTPPPPAALSAPLPAGLPAGLGVIQGEPVGAPGAYRSRAPPVA